MDALVSASTLAKLFNLSIQRICQLAKEGIIPKAAHGKYEFVACVEGYVRFLQRRAEGRGVETVGIHVERSRYLKAQADKIEIENSVRSRALIPADEALTAWGALVAAFRSRMLILPTKLAASLQAVDDPVKIENAIREEVYEGLNELSRYESPRPSHPGNGKRRPRPATANGKRVGRPRVAAKRGGQRRAGPVPQ